MRHRAWIGAALALLAPACATTPIGDNEARTLHVLENPFSAPAPGTGALVITRDSGFMSSACAQRIYVDGYEVAELRQGQKVTLYLAPGEHRAGARSSGICGGGSSGTTIQIQAGGREVYRVSSGQAGDIKIEASPV